MKFVALLPLSVSLSACLGVSDDLDEKEAAQLIASQPRAGGTSMDLPYRTLECLKNAGYVNWTIGGYQITAKGRPHISSTQYSIMRGSPDKITPVSDVPFTNVQISGLRSLDEGKKLIEFNAVYDFQWAQETSCLSLPPTRHQAVAEKYDDGWRVRYAGKSPR